MKRLTEALTPRALLLAGSIVLPAIVLAIVLLLGHQVLRSEADGREAAQSLTARNQVQRAALLLQDIQVGRRGYQATQQEEFRQLYRNAQRRLQVSLPRLIAALKADAALRPAAVTMQTQLGIVLRQTAHDVADDRVLQAARDNANSLLETQAAALAGQLQAHDDDYRGTLWLVGGLLATLVLFVALCARMVLANLKAGEKVIAEVRMLTDQLSAEKERLLKTVRELNIAKRSADNANQAKSEFLASMSHELRTPLNAILGFSEVIKDELFGPVGMGKYVDYAADVHKSGQHLLELINDVLDLSKIDAGKMELREENVDLAGLAEDSMALMRERASKGGVSLLCEGPARGPVVLADCRLVKQILLNLLSNAIKFTPSGGVVTVRISCNDDSVVLAVRDTGIGMSKIEIEKAMSPYGQIDSKVAREHQGTGLGLPISLSLARLHDGTLEVQSVPGQGTSIALLLPAARLREPATKTVQKTA